MKGLWLVAAVLYGCGPSAPDAATLGARVADLRAKAGISAPVDTLASADADAACHSGEFAACRVTRRDLSVRYSVLEGAPEAFEDRLLWHQKQCDRAVVNACDNLGVHYLLGEGATQDLKRATEAFKRAQALGHPLSTVRLAQVAERQNNVAHALALFKSTCSEGLAEGCAGAGQLSPSAEEAATLLKTGCRLGSGPACAQQARAAKRAGDLAAATAGFQAGCEAGYGVACAEIGGLQMTSAETLPAAHTALMKACEAGAPAGCRDLAELHRKGRGTEKDPTLAGSLLRRGCRLGDGHSCSRAARMYRQGRAVAPDPKRAIALFSRACRMDRGADCLDLGLMLSKNTLKAQAFNHACGLGVVEGCARLGLAQLRGEGVPLHINEGRKALQSACDQKLAFACLQLALAYQNGEGLPPDPAKARRYFERAEALKE